MKTEIINKENSDIKRKKEPERSRKMPEIVSSLQV